MSQKLAVSSSHQHSASLVMSWNTSMLHSRPEAQQGRTHQHGVVYKCVKSRLEASICISWKGAVSVSMVPFLFVCLSYRHMLKNTPAREHHTAMFTTTPSLPRHVRDPFRCQTNIFSCPVTIPRQMMDAQTKAGFTSLLPSNHMWMSEKKHSVFCGATPPGEQEEGKGKESSKEWEKVKGGGGGG